MPSWGLRESPSGSVIKPICQSSDQPAIPPVAPLCQPRRLLDGHLQSKMQDWLKKKVGSSASRGGLNCQLNKDRPKWFQEIKGILSGCFIFTLSRGRNYEKCLQSQRWCQDKNDSRAIASLCSQCWSQAPPRCRQQPFASPSHRKCGYRLTLEKKYIYIYNKLSNPVLISKFTRKCGKCEATFKYSTTGSTSLAKIELRQNALPQERYPLV